MTRLFRYIPFHRMADALALGWLPTPALIDCHHGVYAVLCERVCECGRMPEHVGARP